MIKFRMVLLIAAALFVFAACSPAVTSPDNQDLPNQTPGEAAVPETGPVNTCPDGITAEELTAQGETLYATSCAQCHGAQGEGVGDFPPLLENLLVTGQDIPALVSAYFAVEAHPRLEAQDAAAAFTYMRNAWGNQATLICAEQVLDAALEPEQ